MMTIPEILKWINNDSLFLICFKKSIYQLKNIDISHAVIYIRDSDKLRWEYVEQIKFAKNEKVYLT